jgi:hypothetical protein
LTVFASIAVLVAAAPLWAAADPVSTPSPADQIVDRYLCAVQNQESHPKDLRMDIDINAKLPRLKKQGRWQAFRFITRLGKIFYDRPHYEGDNTVKKEVIARYLEAEKQARNDYSGSLALTPANYKFKYKGTADYAGRTAYVLQVTPKEKRMGLFKGELWIDSQTYLPLREWGELVKNPSVFLKSVYFVRDYWICDGMSVPRRLISDVDTRIVGKAQLTIWFDNFKVVDDAATAAAEAASPMAQAGGVTH